MVVIMIATKILGPLALCVALSACNQGNMCEKISDQKTPLEFDITLSVSPSDGSGDNFLEPKIFNVKRQVYRDESGFTSIYDIIADGNSKYTNVYGMIQSVKIYDIKDKKDRTNLYTYDKNPEINAMGNRKDFYTAYTSDADGKKSKMESVYKYVRDEHVNISGCNIRTSLYDVETKQKNASYSTKAIWYYSPDLKSNIKYELTSYNDGKAISKATTVPNSMVASFNKAADP